MINNSKVSELEGDIFESNGRHPLLNVVCRILELEAV